MSKKFRWNMFYTSFIPLWVSLIVIYTCNIVEYLISNKFSFCEFIKVNGIQVLMIFILIITNVISIYKLLSFLKNKKNENDVEKSTISNVKKCNKFCSEFLLAYILPMVAFDFMEIKSILIFLIYFFTIAFLCIRNNNVYSNILLEIFKYKFYEGDVTLRILGELKTIKKILIISKVDLSLPTNKSIIYYNLEKEIYINLEEKSE